MKIISVDSEVWWIALPDELRGERGIVARSLIQSMATKFAFLSLPTSVPSEGGLVFERGQYGDIAIFKLTVYSDGISIHVPSKTDDAETVLREVLDLAYSIGVQRPITPPLHYPVSRIVADFEHSIDRLLTPFGIGEEIEKRLTYSGKSHLLNFAINIDPLTLPKRIGGINPSMFRIERRDGIEYEKNRYFCFANMTTKDHTEILELFERAASP